MKRFLIAMFVVVFIVFLGSSNGLAATYTIPLADLADANFVTQIGNETGRTQVNVSGILYEQYTYNADSANPVQTGDSFDWDSSSSNNNYGFDISSLPLASDGLGDLSAFSDYRLAFYNPNDDPIHVNIFFNTGDTDAVPGSDRFYQNGWVWLDPGASAVLTINFASADTYIGGVSQGYTAVQNLSEVSNIGFQVELPGPADDYTWGAGTGSFSVDVAPVPIPAALWLLGSGLIGLIGIRRRMTK